MRRALYDQGPISLPQLVVNLSTQKKDPMKLSATRKLFKNQVFLIATASLCVVLLTQGNYAIAQTPEAQSAVQQTTTTTSDAPVIPADQLDSLVAPIALFPDPLLAQTLAASTYPLEIIQLQQWMEKNPGLKDKALADAVAKQPWDPSVQALAIVPDVVQRLAGNIQWTTDLGNAFLAQQSDVMDAVQRMRGKAETKGALKTSSQQVVETKVVEGGKQVIEIQPAQADVVYVPSYDPVVVYGQPAYPYYPYTYPGYYPGMGLAWGAAGFALGAWAGGAWGNCNWGNGDININRNNNFNRNTSINGGNRATQLPSRGGGGNWQHNPSHRGNAPYGDRGTADKFGGSSRGDRGSRGDGSRGDRGNASRGNGSRGNASRGDGSRGGAGNRPGGGASTKPANRQASGAKSGNRQSGGAKSANRQGGGASARPSGGNAGRQSSTRPSSTRSSSQVGNRRVSSGNRGSSNAFSSGGRSGSASRASSNRGGRSMGGGGMSRGGGGGGRGGGGGGRR